MKQFILQHEKALTRIFAVFHILLHIFAFLLFSTIVALGTHYAMTHCTFPVSNEKAQQYIDFLISNYFFCVSLPFCYMLCKNFLGYNISIHAIFEKSILLGLILELLLLGFVFCIRISTISTFVIDISILYLIAYIVFNGIFHIYKEAVSSARRKQMLRLQQCFKSLAENAIGG